MCADVLLLHSLDLAGAEGSYAAGRASQRPTLAFSSEAVGSSAAYIFLFVVCEFLRDLCCEDKRVLIDMSEALRHPIRRTKTKLAEHDQKHEHHHVSELGAVRHPLKRTKSKINEHDHKKTEDPEELSLLERKPFRYPRIPTIYKNKMARPRWVLHVQAQFWRVLMGLGMFFHRMAPPRPPKPNFTRTIQSTISGKPGSINLMFYTPMGYEAQMKQWKDKPRDSDTDDDNSGGAGKRKRRAIPGHRRRSSGQRRWGDYPVVLNFHGGGFTLGSPTDDGRWCHTVVDECNAVVISVDYRLAPEHPFPTAVEDGVDAVIWTHQHAEELGLDPDKIALSGFSSGANMAFTVPLRLWDEMMGFPRGDDLERPESSLRNPFDTPAASKTTLSSQQEPSRVEVLDPAKKPPPLYRGTTKVGAKVSQSVLHQVSDISLKAIVPWYPSLDYTRTRAQRRATCVRKDQELPALFTDLFDESCVLPPLPPSKPPTN